MQEKTYEQVEFLNQEGLYSDEIISQNDLPEGLFVYYLRRQEPSSEPVFYESDYSSLEMTVDENLFGGSIILKKPLHFGENGKIEIDEDNQHIFTGIDLTLQEFLEHPVY